MNDAKQEWFLELVRLARRQAAPEMDVRAAVLARIARPANESLRPLAVAASLSAAAAVGLVFVAARAWSGMTDPMTGLLCSIDINVVRP